MILSWLAKFCEQPDNLNLACEKGIGDRVVDLLSSTPFSNEPQIIDMVESGLLVIQRIAKANKAATTHMDGVIKTMDTFKTRKGVVEVS